MNQVNSFKLGEYEVLFFDIFHKDDQIYLIMPIYHKGVSVISEVSLSCGNIDLKISEQIIKDEYEPIQIAIYDFESKHKENTFRVEYRKIVKSYDLTKIDSHLDKKLTLTTLFKDDFKLLDIFYKYYIDQGVEYFYLYYNGEATTELKSLCSKNNITLISWNFRYWNTNDKFYQHHAQMGQIHHAMYKYGKDNSEAMILCDLDEYLHLPTMKLKELITTSPSVSTFGFCNFWSDTLDGKMIQKFPETFYIGDKVPFTTNSKCIHRLKDVTTVNIHRGNTYSKLDHVTISDYKMFHFYKWSGKNRKKNTNTFFSLKNSRIEEKCISVVVQNFPDEKCNGVYVSTSSLKADNGVSFFIKDDNHHLYRYNNEWRLAKLGVKVYYKLNENDVEFLSTGLIDYIDVSRVVEKSEIKDNYRYQEINMFTFLQDYKGKEIIYVPNPGNCGDSLIAYGTLQIFKKVGLSFIIGNANTIYINKLLFFGGGGNLTGSYVNCRNFINNNKDANEIVLLPHTIKNEDSLLKSLGENIKIFCREKTSYLYVSSLLKNVNNLFLSHDMAFHIKNIEKYLDCKGNEEGNCFRTDSEKTNIIIPKNNNDISNTLNQKGNTTDVTIIELVSLRLFDYISKYRVINTSRLHIAIAASLLNKEVNFYPNNYYKNEAVYFYSMESKYPKTKFF
jgi:exopolysaccharide biosynthesis predicted pyruvyltransferase EpsI